MGAQRGDILKIVLRQGIRAAVAGVAFGLVAGLVLTRLMRSLLYGIAPSDAFTFSAVAILLLLVAFAACLLPARRTTHVDPVVALGYE
jgi:putative ABC transport system permease protein